MLTQAQSLISPTAAREASYRAFATVNEKQPWLATVEDQLTAWLRGRRQPWDVDLTNDGRQAAGGRRLTIRRHPHGKDRGLRFILEEEAEESNWTTRIVAVDDQRGGGWLSITVANSRGMRADVPNIARFLLQALHLQDGDCDLTAEPHVVVGPAIDDVLALLQHPNRRAPVFVAATDTQLSFEKFRRRLGKWTSQAAGIGHTILLDPSATAVLLDQVGPAWATPPWTIRTYLPGVDLSAPTTARQHRILGTRRLATDSDRYLCTLLGWIARSAIARHRPPTTLTTWQRHFDRLENADLAAAITQPPTPTRTHVATELGVSKPETSVVTEAERYLAEYSRITQILGIHDLEDETLYAIAELATAPRVDPEVLETAVQHINEQQDIIERLQEERDSRAEQLEAEQLEHMVTREELEATNDRVAWLQRQLAAAGEYDAAFGTTPETERTSYPGSYAELLERAGELKSRGIWLTADPDVVLSLEQVDANEKYLHTTWEVLLALADYVRARQTGDARAHVQDYLDRTPVGYRGFPPGKHSRTESRTTMQQFGDERGFPVPTSVSSTGKIVMKAHFKLAQFGTVSPRMYYLDDFSKTGRIYVGYIGPHLTNTKTN